MYMLISTKQMIIKVIMLRERSQKKKYILYSFIDIKFEKMQTNLLRKANQCLPGEGRRREWRKDYEGAGRKS